MSNKNKKKNAVNTANKQTKTTQTTANMQVEAAKTESAVKKEVSEPMKVSETKKASEIKKKSEKKVSEKKRVSEKKKVPVRDWILVGVSVLALLILIYIVYATREYDRAVSEMLENDSQKENFTVEITTDAIDSVQINEVSSEKWIELYNSGKADADISGLKVYVSGKVAATVEAGTNIASESYLVVDLTVNPGMTDENVISIVTNEDKIIDSMLVPKLSNAKSYGLTRNDDNSVGFMEASKGNVNNTELSVDDYVYYDGIGFSTPSGFYDKTFILSLSSKSGDTIYYTTDGTEPTKESEQYTDGITINSKSGSNYTYARLGFGYLGNANYYPSSIDAGTVVKAITVNAAGKVTGTAMQEYYIGLANDSAYSNIPVLSLTAKPDDLFGYFDGIYVAGRSREDAIIMGDKSSAYSANFYNGWSRDGKISFFETEKGMTFEADTSVSIYEDIQTINRQKSFKFKFSDIDAFEGSSIMDYISEDDSLVLQVYIDDMDIKVRDAIANDLMRDSKVGTLDISPCILFVNGEYWGVYLLKKPYDASYVERHFGINEKLYFHTGNENQKEFNDMYRFVTENDMRNSENYEQAKKLIDIDSYLEYVCVNVYLGNSNFSTTKGTTWRTVTTAGIGYKDGRWRWLMNYPIGNSMGNSTTQTYSIDTFLQSGLRGDRFFQSLLMNKEFCTNLVSTMNKMINERFTSENWETIVDENSAHMKKASVDSYIRFFGSMKDAQYNAGVEVIRDFLANRAEYMIYYTKELAEKGGDLAYIDELEAQGKLTEETLQGYYDENGEFIATEGEDAEALENGENTESTDNAGRQETGNSNG